MQDEILSDLFSQTLSSQGFFESQHIVHKLNSSRGDFERAVGVKVAYIGVSQCRMMHCPENYSCQTVFKPQNMQIRIMSERTTYISYEHSRSHACMCDRDSGGKSRYIESINASEKMRCINVASKRANVQFLSCFFKAKNLADIN